MTKEQLVAKKIGEFFLAKNQGDYTATYEILKNIHFTQIAVDESACPSCGHIYSATVTITASRIGPLIGRRGLTLEALEAYLGMKVTLKEDYTVHMVFPLPPTEAVIGDDSTALSNVDDHER